MTNLVLATLFAAVAIAAAVTINHMAHRLDQLRTALQAVMYGTFPDGTPRPRCEACLHPDGTRPTDLDHVPGCPTNLTSP